jgi:hypothetical protein
MEALHALLLGGLSADETERNTAEQQLNELSLQPGYAHAVATIGCDPTSGVAVEIRQLACLVLKGFVKNGQWSAGVTTDEERQAVRPMLMASLADPTARIRTAVGVVIGFIGKEEWPDAWPDMIAQLVGHIQSGGEHQLAGAIRCLQIFSDDISDSQLPSAIAQLWPSLIQLLMQPQACSARLRMRSMCIMHNLMSTFGDCVGANVPGARKQLPELLQPCIAASVAVLQAPASADEADEFGLKMQTLRTMTLLFQTFPKSMAKVLPSLLPVLVEMLEASLSIHEAQSVECEGDGDAGYDSDGTPLGLDSCIIELLDLINALVAMPRFKTALTHFLERITYVVVGFLQMTEQQMESWAEDLNQYVADEDEESFEYSIRLSSRHALHEISNEYAEAGRKAVIDAAAQRMQEASALRESGAAHWWKRREGALAALTIAVGDGDDEGAGISMFDAPALLQELLTTDLVDENSHPFLYGQALIAAAKMVSVGINAENLGVAAPFLEASGRCLNADFPPAIKLCACRALAKILPAVKNVGEAGKDCLSQYVLPLLEGLCALLQGASDDTLHLLFDAILAVVDAHAEATTAAEPQLTPVLVQVWVGFGRTVASETARPTL